jgi:hypothetical protein
MKIKNKQAWDIGVANNQDAYGSCVYRYAERWADLMEKRMSETGKSLKEIAKDASHEADIEGITGFIYGCAVQVLALCWEHGEDLRRWHNLDCQLKDEGEKANESGGVLNPAVINIGI